MGKVIKWLDNYWYHYKWHTIIAAFFGIFLIFATGQMLKKDKYDVNLLYAGPAVISASYHDAIKYSVAQVMDDYNGDGKKSVSLYDMTILSPEQLEEARKEAETDGGLMYSGNTTLLTMQQFNSEMVAGDSVICLLDPYMYKDVYSIGGFRKLEEVLGYTPESAIDDCGVRLSDTDFGKFFTGINWLPEDTVMCVKVISSAKNMKGGSKEEKRYEQNLELFRAIMDFKIPENEMFAQ